MSFKKVFESRPYESLEIRSLSADLYSRDARINIPANIQLCDFQVASREFSSMHLDLFVTDESATLQRFGDERNLIAR